MHRICRQQTWASFAATDMGTVLGPQSQIGKLSVLRVA